MSVGRKNKRGRTRKGSRRSVPQRTCTGCRAVRPKRELMRVVRTPDGLVQVDPSGKQSGRGAYLCQQKNCWEKALKRRSLDHALKVTLDDQTVGMLNAFAQTLPEQAVMVSNASEQENP